MFEFKSHNQVLSDFLQELTTPAWNPLFRGVPLVEILENREFPVSTAQAFNAAAVTGLLRERNFREKIPLENFKINFTTGEMALLDQGWKDDCFFIGQTDRGKRERTFIFSTLLSPASTGAELIQVLNEQVEGAGIDLFSIEAPVCQDDLNMVDPGWQASVIASALIDPPCIPAKLLTPSPSGLSVMHIMVNTPEDFPDPLTTGTENDRLHFFYKNLWELIQEKSPDIFRLVDPVGSVAAAAFEAGLNMKIMDKHSVIMTADEGSVKEGVPLGLHVFIDKTDPESSHVNWLHHC